MALPSLSYTWVYDVNQLISAELSVIDQARSLLYAIKKSLTAGISPLIVQGSSNGVTGAMDLVDRWTNISDVTWEDKSGDPHSWIVLQTSGVYSFQLLIDCDDKAISGNGRIRLSVSPSASFTGGNIYSAPTAPDESEILEGTWFSETNTNHILHMWRRDNGYSFRIAVWRQSTNLSTLWLFENGLNAITGFTQPNLYMALGRTSGICNIYDCLSSYSVDSPITGTKQAYHNGWMTLGLTGEGIGLSVPPTATSETGIIAASSLSLNYNDINSEWPLFPIGVVSNTFGNRGRHCNVADMWWRPSGVSPYADVLPSSGPPSFVVMGDLIFPWDGSTPVIA